MPQLTFTVNGRAWSEEVPAGMSLLDVLRDRVGTTGVKLGCGEGRCGSCTVLLDGRAVSACMVPAASADRAAVTTIEGLAEGGRLHPVQQAFLDHQAFQCGFCTPGMILGAVALLAEHTAPDDETIRRALDGHLCRCGAYPQIVGAVRAAAAAMVGEGDRG